MGIGQQPNRSERAGPEARGIALRLGRPVTQLVFRFCQILGILPLTGTSQLKHMRLDLDASELELSAADVSALAKLSEV